MWSWAYNQLSCPHTFHFEYVRDYFDELKDYNKLAIVFNALIHDNLNYLENAGIHSYYFIRKWFLRKYYQIDQSRGEI